MWGYVEAGVGDEVGGSLYRSGCILVERTQISPVGVWSGRGYIGDSWRRCHLIRDWTSERRLGSWLEDSGILTALAGWC